MERGGMDKARLNRLAGATRMYIEKVWPLYERSGDLPELPMDRKAKGEWNPPVGEYIHVVMEANREASKYLNPRLEELKRHRVSFKGFEFRDLLSQAAYDSGAFAKSLSIWPAKNDAFWELCYLVARSLALEKDDSGEPLDVRKGGFWVNPNPDASSEYVGDPRTVRPSWRTITAADAYRWIVSRLEAIRVEYPEADEAACEGILSQRLEKEGHNGSIGRIRHAKTFVNKERSGGDEAA